MRLLTRYLAREIYGSVLLVFAALIMLFAFLDLVHELNVLGRGNYSVGYVLLFVLLTVPGHISELFPVAVLIGSIVAMVQMAANSELTIYRSSGASLGQMIKALLKIGIPLVMLSVFCSEILAPPSEKMAQRLRLKAQNAQLTLKEFRSGVWVKDERSFVNVKSVLPDASLQDVSIYTFDDNYRLSSITLAQRAMYSGDEVWHLEEVAQTLFERGGSVAHSRQSMDWHSALNPNLLNVLMVVPEQMSIWNLFQYIEHLRDNRQQTVRYEIVMWNKLVSPLAVFVMLLLALPFANYHRREGGIGAKVFAGIVLGLSFHFLGRLTGSLGALNAWSPFLSALTMPTLFALLACGMLLRAERR